MNSLGKFYQEDRGIFFVFEAQIIVSIGFQRFSWNGGILRGASFTKDRRCLTSFISKQWMNQITIQII